VKFLFRKGTNKTMATPKRQQIIAELRGLETGIKKNLATFTFIVAAKRYTGPEALAFVQKVLGFAEGVAMAHASLTKALMDEKTFLAINGKTLKALRDMIRLMYGDGDATVLAEFKIEPRKVRKQMTNETLLLRAAKSRATRAKRRTMGKRQKARIKGDVTGVVIEPVISGAPAPSEPGSTPSGGGNAPT
jgi:hypothetical protein